VFLREITFGTLFRYRVLRPFNALSYFLGREVLPGPYRSGLPFPTPFFFLCLRNIRHLCLDACSPQGTLYLFFGFLSSPQLLALFLNRVQVFTRLSLPLSVFVVRVVLRDPPPSAREKRVQRPNPFKISWGTPNIINTEPLDLL